MKERGHTSYIKIKKIANLGVLSSRNGSLIWVRNDLKCLLFFFDQFLSDL